jgi:DNA-binding transcriptional regulator YhcF (GntR family)
MLLANRNPHNYMGGVIDRGEVLASYEFLAKHTGLSVQNVRTAISNLKKTNMIKHRIINGTNVFTIVKYMDYQQEKQP